MTDAELFAKAERVRQSRIELARTDSAVFNELVLRDEQTGRPIAMAPYHLEWHDLMDRHDRLVLWSHVDAGKSWQVSIGRTLFDLGRNQNLRFGIISNTGGSDSTSSKIANAIREYVERSDLLHQVFPNLKPGPIWRGTSFTVERPEGQKTGPKDFSVESIGIMGHFQGARFDIIVIDDVLDMLNTLTDHQRKHVIRWIEGDVIGRLAVGGKIRVVGNVYHKNDALHHLAAKTGWVSRKYPVLGEDGKTRWPQHWPDARINQAKIDMGPSEFMRKILCVVRADSEARFKEEWLYSAFARGNGKKMCWALKRVPPGYATHTGVDLAVSTKDAADLTVLFTILVHPNGTREILCIESGRWAGPEIIDRIKQTHHRFQSIITLENNAGQRYVQQMLETQTAIPVRGFTTGMNKHQAFGIESLAVELSASKWIIPNMDGVFEPEVEALIQDILGYDPRGHTGDRLMAMWFSREGAREGAVPEAESGAVDFRRR